MPLYIRHLTTSQAETLTDGSDADALHAHNSIIRTVMSFFWPNPSQY